MNVVRDLQFFIPPLYPAIATLGNFDGVHAGHQAILKRVVDEATKVNGISTVVTFNNHPSQILRPERAPPLLCSLEHKLHLLEKMGIQRTIVLTFSMELSQWDAEHFLSKLCESFPISQFILGHDAAFGKNRGGTKERLESFAKQVNLQLEYLDPIYVEGQLVSSSVIRDLVIRGELMKASKLLGRKYSFYGPIRRGKGKGKILGFPTANLEIKGLCHPPFGVYAVKIVHQSQILFGVANFGLAPTLRQDMEPLLEVHIFNYEKDLYEQYVEIILEEYIRPEQKFDNLDNLKRQIKNDIVTSKNILERT